MNFQFVIIALLIAAVAADQAYPAGYPKAYDYVRPIRIAFIFIDASAITVSHDLP